MRYILESSTGSSKDTVIIKNAISTYKEGDSFIYLTFSKIKTPVSSAQSSDFAFQIEQVVNGETYPIEGNSQGVAVRTEPERLTIFDFISNDREVFSPFDATIGTRFAGRMKVDNQVEIIYPDTLRV